MILVERNTEPNGVALVNSSRVAKRNFEELMDLEEDRVLVSHNLLVFFNKIKTYKEFTL